MNALETIPKFESQHEIQEFIAKVSEELDEYDPLDVLARLQAMSKIMEGVKEKIKERVVEQASKYGTKEFQLRGHTFQIKNKKTYKFDHCQVWASVEARKKQIEEQMKIIKAPAQIVDNETGEIVTIEPAHWTGTEYVAVTLKK